MAAAAHRGWAAGGVSLAVNGLLVLAIAGIGAGEPARVWTDPPAMEAVLVSVRGADTPSPTASAQTALPSPTPTPAPPPPPRPLAPPRAATDAPTPLYVPESRPPASPPSSAAAAAAVRSAPVAPPVRAGAAEGLDAQAPSGTSNDYAARLRAWLEAHKTYPRRSRMRREEGVVQIHFAVDRRGRLLGSDIVRSSGYEALDLEALAMLDRAEPFPSAPHGVWGERIEITTPVAFHLQR